MSKELMQKVTTHLEASIPRDGNEYVGQDGLLYCSKCGKARQTRVSFLGDERVVRCICDCGRQEIKTQEEIKRQEKIKRQRNICFQGSELSKVTFETDDRRNPKISIAAKNFAEKFEDFKRLEKGLLFYGNYGTGKSYLSAAIANYLIDAGYKVFMTDIPTIINELWCVEDKQEYIRCLIKNDLLILDDLGAERDTDYAADIVEQVVNARYNTRKPLIVSTNLTAEELKNPTRNGYGRVCDRLMEMCQPIEMNGESRRRQKLKESNAEVKQLLGL